ncbi:MAG: hypothetical protein L0229_22550 [Blastocatellia bacterium]|nr:hypothetical protein [Blastocatellia bacterium]
MATKVRSDYLDKIRHKVPDPKASFPDDHLDALEQSLIEYSASRPNRATDPPSRHAIDESDAANTTVPDEDFWIVVWLASAYVCEYLAIAYTPTAEHSPQADFVDFVSISEKYTTQAKTLRKIVAGLMPPIGYVGDPDYSPPVVFGTAPGCRGA